MREHLVHRTEVLANLTEAIRALFRIVERGALAELLDYSPRPGRPVTGTNRRLSDTEIDQLVADYRSHRSVYVLARMYDVHRNTIARHLKERGVDLSKGMPDTAKEQAARLYVDGKSSASIGKQLGFDNHTIIAALRSMDVAIRKSVAPRSATECVSD